MRRKHKPAGGVFFGNSPKRTDKFESHCRLPLIGAGNVLVRELILFQHLKCIHEHIGQDHCKNRAHGDANHLIAELHDPIGPQAPPGRAVLLHIPASIAGYKNNPGTEQARQRTSQAHCR